MKQGAYVCDMAIKHASVLATHIITLKKKMIGVQGYLLNK